MLFNSRNHTEFSGKCLEALFLSGLCEAVVHIGPLIVLALSSVLKVPSGVADTLKLLEPELCMLLLVVCGL
jgi:hypothetical protein